MSKSRNASAVDEAIQPVQDNGTPPAAPAPEKPKRKQKSRRERFLGVAPKRVRSALKSLSALKACFKRDGYDYQATEAAKIIDAVGKAYTAMVDATKADAVDAEEFTL